MALDYFNGRVYKIVDETKTVKRFFIEFPELDEFEFKSGQYVKVDMPIEGEKTYRQYSIASAPDNSNKIELCVVRNPVGLGTSYLFDEVEIGTELKISKALGRFVLPEKIEKDIVFICTGVGLAPFRSMYLEILKNNLSDKNVHLIFGTRFEEDILYRKEIEELLGKHDNFHFYPTLSRDNNGWAGRRGYVHEIYNEIFSGEIPAHFYLCGWDSMIKEARKNLKDSGYSRRDVLFEKYD
jgi:phenol/toluene 2-monooxygenase (NADH) P5/A5